MVSVLIGATMCQMVFVDVVSPVVSALPQKSLTPSSSFCLVIFTGQDESGRLARALLQHVLVRGHKHGGEDDVQFGADGDALLTLVDVGSYGHQSVWQRRSASCSADSSHVRGIMADLLPCLIPTKPQQPSTRSSCVEDLLEGVQEAQEDLTHELL